MTDPQTSKSYLYDDIIVSKSPTVIKNETCTHESRPALTIKPLALCKNELNEARDILEKLAPAYQVQYHTKPYVRKNSNYEIFEEKM